MFKEKCILEVKNFLKLNVEPTLSANKIIGIDELTQYLNKKINLEKTQDLISIKTRQYAKRQSTWARGNMMSWKKVYSENSNDLIKKILKVIS